MRRPSYDRAASAHLKLGHKRLETASDHLAGTIINSQLSAMVSSNCALCKTPLTGSNDFAEHVIANAIGGIWTVKGFICKPCNDTTGHNWDAELAAQLNGLCHFFTIKRDRGAIPAETITTTAGETFDMLSDDGFALRRPRPCASGPRTGWRYSATTRLPPHALKIWPMGTVRYFPLNRPLRLQENSKWSHDPVPSVSSFVRFKW